MFYAPRSITFYRLTDHAKLEMARRDISEAQVAMVLRSPEQSEPIHAGRAVYQSRFDLGDPPTTFLIRVFVDHDRSPADVVTAYRTSKIQKYWRTE